MNLPAPSYLRKAYPAPRGTKLPPLPMLRTLLYPLALLIFLLGTCGCAPKPTVTDPPVTTGPTTPTTPAPEPTAPVTAGFFGQPTTTEFGAKLYQPKGDMTGQRVMDELRAAFPGKAVYLDIWAVWCQPCLAEFPASKKLHAEAHDLPVEFVYLCTSAGGTATRWNSLVRQNRVPGTHIYLDRRVHEQVMQLLQTNAFPTYALLKTDGSTTRDARRPSNASRSYLERAIR